MVRNAQIKLICKPDVLWANTYAKPFPRTQSQIVYLRSASLFIFETKYITKTINWLSDIFIQNSNQLDLILDHSQHLCQLLRKATRTDITIYHAVIINIAHQPRGAHEAGRGWPRDKTCRSVQLGPENQTASTRSTHSSFPRESQIASDCKKVQRKWISPLLIASGSSGNDNLGSWHRHQRSI